MKQQTLKVGKRVRVIDTNEIGEVVEILANGAAVRVGKVTRLYFASELRRN